MNRNLVLIFVFVLVAASLILVRPEKAEVALGQVTYSGVAFQETGLPNGTVWAVICNGTQYESADAFISISLPPGNYAFYIPDISGYTVFPQNGTATAILDPIKLIDITFSQNTIPEFSTWRYFPLSLMLTILIVLPRARKKRLS